MWTEPCLTFSFELGNCMGSILRMTHNSNNTVEKPRRQRRPLEVRQAELRSKLERIENLEADRLRKQLVKISDQLKDIAGSANAVGNHSASAMAGSLAFSIDTWISESTR